MYTRAIGLEVCDSADKNDFLRAVQLHCFKYGIFNVCISDQGSQILAGANVIETFIDDHEVCDFFHSNGVKIVNFQQYPKGNSRMGACVETMVKQVKLLIAKSLKNVILAYKDFSFLVGKVVSIVNKRPVAFKENLAALSSDEVPSPITPEMLILGYDTPTVNLIPDLEFCEDSDLSSNYDPKSIVNKYEKLRKVRSRLIEEYHKDFLTNLIGQAVDKPERYKPVLHHKIKPGDIVLLVETFTKRYLYPMGRVLSTEVNELGEVTAARILKGGTREVVYRHSTSLILLLSCGSENSDEEPKNDDRELTNEPPVLVRPKRAAAVKAVSKIRTILRS